jgi:pimeloyl-ACP methyl ester carboxylesterase
VEPATETRGRMLEVMGIPTFVRERPGAGTPVVFWHGNPTDSRDWLDFMDRASAPAYAADMPGFGRSARPDPREFDYSMDAYARWSATLLDALDIDRYSLLVHDWGGTGLLGALRDPGRVERMVAFNVVPFGVGYRWHWIAKYFWRRRVLGEVFNSGARVGPLAGFVLRQARPGYKKMPDSFLERFNENWRGPAMRRAMLALYRSADPEQLERAGENLEQLEAPTLLLWAQRDPYIPPVYGRRLAERLPRAELVEIADAGHWPWFDRPDLVGRAVEFLEGAGPDGG